MERSTGFRPPELDEYPPPPEVGMYVLDWFYDLSAARTAGMSLNPISYTEIDAWSRLTGIKPKPWEVAAIKAIDGAFLMSMAKE